MKYLKMTVLAVALLALAAGSAQAQECVAGAKSTNVRAEGATEVVGTITLRCRAPRTPADANAELTLGSSAPTKLEIEVTLNADITNTRDSSDMIDSAAALGYDVGDVMLTAITLTSTQGEGTAIELDPATGDPFSDGDVSDDLRKVTWKAVDTNDDAADGNGGLDSFNIGADPGGTGTADTDTDGFQLVIAGLRADASGVGDGNDITATVKVNGTVAGSADMKVADVATGLDPVVKVAKGRECDDVDTSARVTIKEGNRYSFKQDDSFLITFRNIPEGATVRVPTMVGLVADDPATNANENLESFILELVEGRPGDGVGKVENDMAPVELSASGTGEVRYEIGTARRQTAGANTPNDAADDEFADDPTVADGNYIEWAHVPVYFKWSGGDVSMNADAMVYVSFHPSDNSSLPRFAGDSAADALLTVEDCVTKLTFPFVSSASGYDTGVVVSNTSDSEGSCTASYSGSEDTEDSPMIEGNSHWIFLVSGHMQDYSGRLTVTCDFGGIDGYAQINDHMGNSNGYLPRM